MSAEPIRCSKCNGEMVQGFLFESEGHDLDTWVEGTPVKSWWGGRQGAEGKAHFGEHLPVFGVRILGILCTSRDWHEITPHRPY
jgi:hypothetical protein